MMMGRQFVTPVVFFTHVTLPLQRVGKAVASVWIVLSSPNHSGTKHGDEMVMESIAEYSLQPMKRLKKLLLRIHSP